MYLLYAPREKFGFVPSGHVLITEEVRFYQNIAFCAKQYWLKVHLQNGCRDISPRFFKRYRQNRKLKSITLFAVGGIGDTMWSMPFARALKEKHPQVAIFVVTETKNHGLWQYTPYTAAVVENAYWNVHGLISKSDDVFDFSGVATILKKQMRLDPVEAVFKMGDFPLPKEKEKCRPKMVVTIDEGKQTQAGLLQKGIDIRHDTVIAIGIESSTSNRNWPVKYSVELSQALIIAGYKVIWLGKSPEYSERLIDKELKVDGVVNLVGNTDIRGAMTAISLCDLFIGPNSGLMVIATSFMIPTIGLFGAFRSRLRGKFYDRFEGLDGVAPCAPCGEHWTECRNGHPSPCMKSILPSRVYETVKSMLKKYPRSLIEKLPIE